MVGTLSCIAINFSVLLVCHKKVYKVSEINATFSQSFLTHLKCSGLCNTINVSKISILKENMTNMHWKVKEHCVECKLPRSMWINSINSPHIVPLYAGIKWHKCIYAGWSHINLTGLNANPVEMFCCNEIFEYLETLQAGRTVMYVVVGLYEQMSYSLCCSLPKILAVLALLNFPSLLVYLSMVFWSMQLHDFLCNFFEVWCECKKTM